MLSLHIPRSRVEQLSQQLGLARPPEAHLMQAGGALNAFATKFLRTNLIVPYSDMPDACGDKSYAYDIEGRAYRLWSSGPDGQPVTDHNIFQSGPTHLRR